MEDVNQENNTTEDKTTDAGADASAKSSDNKSMLDVDKIVNGKEAGAYILVTLDGNDEDEIFQRAEKNPIKTHI